MAQSTLPQSVARPALRRAAQWPLLVALSTLAWVGAFGNAWDLYWHVAIGRDTFWIPPHTLMYTAIALSGIAAAAMVIATTLTRPSPDATVGLLGFRAPLGYFVLGFGALQMVLSAPFDDWWHRMYGVDISVWSPPHLIGFSGSTVMLAGLIIALLAERQRSPAATRGREWATYALAALLFGLVARWINFLNSTTLELSWLLKAERYAIAGPWAGWWGLWSGLFMTWVFVASARAWRGPGARWFPAAVLAAVIAARALEFPLTSLGFTLALPWGSQTLRKPFLPFMQWDLGLWVLTLVLVLPALAVIAVQWRGQRWGSGRFGAVAGLSFGGLLAAQFLLLRPALDLTPLALGAQLTVVAVTVAAAVVGGLIGAVQGDWLATFRC